MLYATRPVIAAVWFGFAGASAFGQTDYQSRRAAIDHDAWRQRAFFNSTTQARETPVSTVTNSQSKAKSDGIDWDADRRWKAEQQAWYAKLDRQAKEKRAQAYQEIRQKAEGRLPLTEPPQFASATARTDWYLQEADRNPNDPYVAWSAAESAVNALRPGLTAADARRWLAHADPSWPETKALLGRLLILGEGGPPDIARGWELLRSAEPALRELSLHERARGHVYFAMGRAYAEGIGVAVDDVAALWAFDHNAYGSGFLYSTWSYVVSTFWPARAQHAAEIVEKAEASDLEWNLAPRLWLRSASRLTASATSTAREKADLNELKRQFFACTLVDQNRVGPGESSARYQVTSLVEDGVLEGRAEYLMPDRFGEFFAPRDDNERARWEREGMAVLEELATRGEGRAAAGMTARFLAPSLSSADLPRAEQWAEKGLSVGDPWGALYVARYYAEASPRHATDTIKAQSWMERAGKIGQAARFSEGVYWFIHDHFPSGAERRAREQQWLKFGAEAGVAESIILSSNDGLRELTYDHERAGADEAVWARAERFILDALVKARDRKSRSALRTHLNWLQQRHADSLQQDQVVADYKRRLDAEVETLVAAETPRLPERLAAALQLLRSRVADTAFRAEWGYSNPNAVDQPTSPATTWASRLSARKDAPALLLSAAYYVEVALEGGMLNLFKAEDEIERAAPDSLLLKQWRTEIENALEVLVERGDSSAALWLAEKSGPGGGRGISVEADWHAARWYRRAAEMGHPDALFKLQQFFEDKDPVAELYAPLRSWLTQEGEKEAGIARNELAGLNVLPSPSAEYGAIQEYWKKRDQRREQSLATIARELPEALSKIEEAVKQFEATAASPGKAGAPFFQWAKSDDMWDEENILEEDAPSLETELVITARQMGRAIDGDYYAARTLPGEWFQAQPDLALRWNAAFERVLMRDADAGDIKSMLALSQLYSPEKNAMMDAVGWLKSVDRYLAWTRRAIAAGEFGRIDALVATLAKARDQGGADTYQAWQKFRTEALPLAKAPRSERVAFAAQHLPPIPTEPPRTKP